MFPGGLFFLKVVSEEPSGPKAAFLGKNITFYKLEGNEYGAFLPVNIDTAPGDYSISVKSDGVGVGLIVKVKPYAFPTKKLTLPEKKVTLSPEDSRRVEREYFLQEDIWKIDNEKIWDGVFVFPTDTFISEKFGVKRIMNEKKTSIHRGIDIKGKSGTPIRAINSGKVVLHEDLFYGGYTLVIDHGMGLLSIYMHMSKFNVKDGEEVSKGNIIGFVGMTGRATGPHLHMSVKLQGVSVNPEALMRLKFQE